MDNDGVCYLGVVHMTLDIIVCRVSGIALLKADVELWKVQA